MTCQCTSSARMGATSRTQREVIQAHGQIGSNQKSTFISSLTVPWRRAFAKNASVVELVLGPTDLGESAQSYQGSILATTLPTGLFHDCAGNPVTPGSLFVVADAYEGWFMGPGMCPSQ